MNVKMKKSISSIIFLASILFLVGIALPQSVAQAQDTGLQCPGGNCTYTLLEPLPGSFPSQVGNDTQFYAYLNGIIMMLIILGAMLAVVRFSIGGIIYMTSDIAGNRSKAKSQMWACIWGLLLLISAVLILKTINPNLIKLTFFTNLKCLSGIDAQINCIVDSKIPS